VIDFDREKLLGDMAGFTVFYKGGCAVAGCTGRWPASAAKDFFRAAYITK
jgi:hypothetical protein